MSSSTEQAESWPAVDEARREHRRGNGFATAALVLGVTGVTLVTVVPGLVFGILGLRRAASCGAGRMRSWLGIGLCLFRAADPGCAAYAVRWVAKNVVAAGLADRCEAQVAYAIGKAKPVGLFVECFGTEKIPVAQLQDAVLEVFDLRPGAIIKDLELLRPIYSQTAAFGHFGREEPDFSWERTDRVDALRAVAGV